LWLAVVVVELVPQHGVVLVVVVRAECWREAQLSLPKITA
jgi:hypothetical protein